MVLATTGGRGRPAARWVLLRGLDEGGLVFFTNYRSRKGRELARTPYAAAVFYWAALQKQVRVEGRVVRLGAQESDGYFARRPRDARLAAWASEQSRPLRDRATLSRRFLAMRRRFRGRDVPRPAHWGGFRLVPDAFEFWQNRPHRLHERMRFERGPRGWRVTLLAP
jgi:pyridoxamine 5'-phosphate oxidase